MNNIKKKLFPVLSVGILLGFTSCFDDKDSTAQEYKEWRELNYQYIEDARAEINDDGTQYYTEVVPSWAPGAYVLIHWHNDRKLTQNNLSPMDNSITQIKYELYNVEGKKLSDSYSRADSLYTSRPSQNIIGMWAALTHMNVGDSVTLVIPSQAGYGEMTHSDIPPYSTLIYNVKLKAIPAYEVP